jgi:hypothetical protein
MPTYFGHAMFTGMNLFRHFGSNFVNGSSSNPLVEIFASSNANNAVLVSKDPTNTYTVNFQLVGITCTAQQPCQVDVWTKDQVRSR